MKKMLALVTICMLLLTSCGTPDPYPLFENVTLTDMTLTDAHSVYRGLPQVSVQKDGKVSTFKTNGRICAALVKLLNVVKINNSIEPKIDIVIESGWVVSASLSKARN
jgi:PBP1b-binding outer membrane lipoprotein LpoB